MARPGNEDAVARKHWDEFNKRRADHHKFAAARPEPSSEEREKIRAKEMADLEKRLNQTGN